MDNQKRRNRTIQNQENVHAIRKTTQAAQPTKRQGLGVQGALGDVNSNVPIQRNDGREKVAARAESEKKFTLNRAKPKSYKHVQAKVDTGLASKVTVQPSTSRLLPKEEKSAVLANRGTVQAKLPLKEVQNVELSKQKKDKNALLKKTKEVKPSKTNVTKLLSESAPAESARLKEQVETLENISKEPEAQPPTLAEDIEDIDAGDQNSLFLMANYVNEIYNYLTYLEEKYPVEKDHLRNQLAVTGGMRATLIDWLVEVQMQFNLMLETLQLTVGIIDRYLQVDSYVHRKRLQLVGVTAMFIASKYEETYPPNVYDFVYITSNYYTKQEVLQCERHIMAQLGFCLARPTPLTFLTRFTKAAHGDTKNHHLAQYFVDLSLLKYSMAHYMPSRLAAAALCLSLHLLSGKNLDAVWTMTLCYYSGYSLKHIEPIIREIADLVINAESSKYKAVYTKYQDKSLDKVAILPQLKGNAILALTSSPTDDLSD